MKKLKIYSLQYYNFFFKLKFIHKTYFLNCKSMIQRIQTVFLFLISFVFIIGLLFILPTDFPDFRLPLYVYLKYYFVFTAILAFLTLLLFKYRKTQLILNRINFFIQVIASAGFIYIILNSEDFNSYIPCIIFPILALILLLLSSRFINKDEKLIRSIDRLR